VILDCCYSANGSWLQLWRGCGVGDIDLFNVESHLIANLERTTFAHAAASDALLSNSATNAPKLQTWSVSAASIAGVTRKVW
jgi:hypothetical protein